MNLWLKTNSILTILTIVYIICCRFWYSNNLKARTKKLAQYATGKSSIGDWVLAVSMTASTLSWVGYIIVSIILM